jgi:hypothetical protein
MCDLQRKLFKQVVFTLQENGMILKKWFFTESWGK